ncbi:hypothetical protein BDB01DRAFT_852788 [Pilobolus umbonatus]|nr:hypothetical protein BDB01DRAFT_852788 [Pilobolus umbonatus]
MRKKQSTNNKKKAAAKRKEEQKRKAKLNALNSVNQSAQSLNVTEPQITEIIETTVNDPVTAIATKTTITTTTTATHAAHATEKVTEKVTEIKKEEKIEKVEKLSREISSEEIILSKQISRASENKSVVVQADTLPVVYIEDIVHTKEEFKPVEGMNFLQLVADHEHDDHDHVHAEHNEHTHQYTTDDNASTNTWSVQEETPTIGSQKTVSTVVPEEPAITKRGMIGSLKEKKDSTKRKSQIINLFKRGDKEKSLLPTETKDAKSEKKKSKKRKFWMFWKRKQAAIK